MKKMTCPVQIKAAGEQDGTEDGVFEAIVATYDVDSVGDKIIPGAFADTLAEWKASGHPIPVLWSHMSHDPDYHIGFVEEAEEREDGLWVRARIDLDEPKAKKVYKLLKGKRVRQFSFAYDVQEGGWIESKDDDGTSEGYFELRKLKLYEVGPTLIGANQSTELLTVKNPTAPARMPAAPDSSGVTGDAPELKAGRTLSAKNETALRDALAKIAEGTDAIETVLSALDSNDDEKATGPAIAPPAPPAAAPSNAASAALLRAEMGLLEADSEPLTA
jgi:HK97 family phage prohead protease